MATIIHIVTFGSLAKDRGETPGEATPLELSGPTSFLKLLDRLRIKPHRVQLVMVNHRAVSGLYFIQPGDRVALFPQDYPFFADWKDFRFPVSNQSTSPV